MTGVAMTGVGLNLREPPCSTDQKPVTFAGFAFKCAFGATAFSLP